MRKNLKSRGVITGEGKIDTQTFYGKSLSRIFSFQKNMVFLIILAGEVDKKVYRKIYSENVIIMSILPELLSKKEAMERGKEFLRIKAEQIFKILKWKIKN